MGAIAMFILVIVISIVGVIFFTVQDHKEAKKAKQLKAE